MGFNLCKNNRGLPIKSNIPSGPGPLSSTHVYTLTTLDNAVSYILKNNETKVETEIVQHPTSPRRQNLQQDEVVRCFLQKEEGHRSDIYSIWTYRSNFIHQEATVEPDGTPIYRYAQIEQNRINRTFALKIVTEDGLKKAATMNGAKVADLRGKKLSFRSTDGEFHVETGACPWTMALLTIVGASKVDKTSFVGKGMNFSVGMGTGHLNHHHHGMHHGMHHYNHHGMHHGMHHHHGMYDGIHNHHHHHHHHDMHHGSHHHHHHHGMHHGMHHHGMHHGVGHTSVGITNFGVQFRR